MSNNQKPRSNSFSAFPAHSSIFPHPEFDRPQNLPVKSSISPNLMAQLPHEIPLDSSQTSLYSEIKAAFSHTSPHPHSHNTSHYPLRRLSATASTASPPIDSSLEDQHQLHLLKSMGVSNPRLHLRNTDDNSFPASPYYFRHNKQEKSSLSHIDTKINSVSPSSLEDKNKQPTKSKPSPSPSFAYPDSHGTTATRPPISMSETFKPSPPYSTPRMATTTISDTSLENNINFSSPIMSAMTTPIPLSPPMSCHSTLSDSEEHAESKLPESAQESKPMIPVNIPPSPTSPQSRRQTAGVLAAAPSSPDTEHLSDSSSSLHSMDSMDPLEPLDTSRKHVGRRHHFRRPGIAIKFSPLDDGDAAVLGVDVLDGGGSTDFWNNHERRVSSSHNHSSSFSGTADNGQEEPVYKMNLARRHTAPVIVRAIRPKDHTHEFENGE